MNCLFKKCLLSASIAATIGVTAPTVVFAESDSFALEEVIVTARRKDEMLQDTPLTVNAVTDEKLKDLNINNFADLGSVVAGLSLSEDVIASGASLRGVKYEVLAQADASVEFYQNDAHVTALQTLQKMYDVAQVEVLRGPQGTLRGRASPSGSITITTHKADLDAFGGYVDTTLSDDGDQNYQAAVNLPVIEDKLAFRVAGFWDESNLNDVSSAFTGETSSYEGSGFRLTMTAQPTDELSINATYEKLTPDRKTFKPVESLAGASKNIKATDRKSVQDVAELSSQDLETTTFNLVWDFSDSAALYYTGSYSSVVLEQREPADVTNALDSSYPAAFTGARDYLYTDADSFTHEIRLQSTEPVLDKIDYVIGGAYEEKKSTVVNTSTSFVDDALPDFIYGFVGPGMKNIGQATTETVIHNFNDNNDADTKEHSIFANVTYHFTDATELSLGARAIQYEFDQFITLSTGRVLQDELFEDESEIFTAAFSHHFNEDLMGYVNWGTSWRAGPTLIGVLANSYSDQLNSFIEMPSETSESLEFGMKSTWMDQRLQVNVAAYRQEFDNLSYRSPDAIYFDTAGFISGPVSSYNLQAPVPVIVNGLEVEANFAATEQLMLSGLFNYAKGEIDDGVVPCNDYQPFDGKPDSSASQPTLAQIRAAAGTDQVTSCRLSQQTNTAPDISATLIAEYSFELAGHDAYVRGLYSYYGSTDNSPTNDFDDVSAYGIMNVYAGLKDPDGVWSAMIYVKNLADTVKVVEREASPATVTITRDQLGGFLAGSYTAVSDYRTVSLTPEREFGVNVRYNF